MTTCCTAFSHTHSLLTNCTKKIDFDLFLFIELCDILQTSQCPCVIKNFLKDHVMHATPPYHLRTQNCMLMFNKTEKTAHFNVAYTVHSAHTLIFWRKEIIGNLFTSCWTEVNDFFCAMFSFENTLYSQMDFFSSAGNNFSLRRSCGRRQLFYTFFQIFKFSDNAIFLVSFMIKVNLSMRV